MTAAKDESPGRVASLFRPVLDRLPGAARRPLAVLALVLLAVLLRRAVVHAFAWPYLFGAWVIDRIGLDEGHLLEVLVPWFFELIWLALIAQVAVSIAVQWRAERRADRGIRLFERAHGAEIAELERRIDLAPGLIDEIENEAARIDLSVAAIDHGLLVPGAVELGEQDEFGSGHVGVAHRALMAQLADPGLDVTALRAQLVALRASAGADVDAVLDAGQEDLDRLAVLEDQREQARTAGSEAAGGGATVHLDPTGAGASASVIVPVEQGDLLLDAPTRVMETVWGRSAERAARTVWDGVQASLEAGEHVEAVFRVKRKRPPLDVVVVTDRRLLAYDVTSAAAGPTPVHVLPLASIGAVRIVGFMEVVELRITGADGLVLGPLGHTADRDLVQWALRPRGGRA
ncbi:hypothetical protein [Nocardioides yefusunii]|uniref:Uncharacterized protein n=1 Tax=Nocardioides yefusunii TaxID=2500546 RepID=A0ABW1QYI3_9ACTN|nr:hypothetical protein [Nocardioides yefusunii]